jgi:hypothetical protein
MKRSVDWSSLPREARWARVMWPHLCDAEDQRDMANLAWQDGKKSPLQGQADAEQARRQQQQGKRR